MIEIQSRRAGFPQHFKPAVLPVFFAMLAMAATLAAEPRARQVEAVKEDHPKQFVQSGAWNWPDSAGNHINAHGAGFLYHEGTYYWYGQSALKGFAEENGWEYGRDFPQDGKLPRGLAQEGFSCYSSKDLMSWKNEGVVLAAVRDNPAHDLSYGGILERPKVIHNKKTGKFVMHFKLKLKSEGEAYAKHGSPMYYGVAVADKPTGPFVYSHKYLMGGEAGAGDLTLFVDDDGKGYLFGAKKPKHLMGFIRLTDDYLNVTGEFTPLSDLATGFEAPAVFKHKGTYFVWGSGTRGFHPTVSKAATAPAITGPWKLTDGFARAAETSGGPDRKPELTFGGQVTYVLPVEGKKDAFIAVLDQWRPTHQFLASYMWLPVKFDGAGTAYLEWADTWNFNRW
ncbi:MAG: family 43 glycosylhydrolase [Verrucomicrobia bacterium]|nr:family 43 glycosylhydrolase [Verrucomicrobiota bacterium]